MPELPNGASPGRDEKGSLTDAITRQDAANLPSLRGAVNFTYTPQDASQDATFAVQDQVVRDYPALPEPKKVEQFYTNSLPHLHMPTAISAQKETLDLDAMLAVIRPKKDEHAAQILSVALKFWRTIDGRGFGASPYQATPFKVLEAQAHTARELLERTKATMRTIKTHFLTPPQKVLQTFVESVTHYRGDHAWRSVHEATLLAAYELVYDTGTTPNIPRPETQRGDDSRPKDSAKPSLLTSQETKPRKVLNYGRPDKESDQSDAPRSNEPSDAEIRHKMLEQASVEGEAFLHKQRVKEYNSFKEEIRKPKHPHERYGRLSGTLSSARAARELSGIPNWIQHAIDVSGADSTHDSPHIPAIQTVALEIADWAAKFIQYTELYVSPEATHSWDLTWLQNLLAPPIKYHIHCKHVIQIVDDLSQQIRDLGGYESLHSEDKAIVDLLAPVREASESIEIKNSWGSEPISREVAGQASARRAKEEQIRLLALTLLKNRPGELRYIEDPERAWKMAMQMAKEAIEHPRRPLG